MFVASGMQDYQLYDTGEGMKLESWAGIWLSRPDPQAIWKKQFPGKWEKAAAVYRRSSAGGGHWEYKRKLPERWEVEIGGLRFYVRPTGFKHTGLFPEQSCNWAFIREHTAPGDRVLNLFAYTGGATLAAAAAGAEVAHVDAAKGMVAWARENAALSGLSDRPIRYIVDDCLKFVKREQRRGRQYEGIIMDPPSYGRGSGGEVWKLEDSIAELVEEAAKLAGEVLPLELRHDGAVGGRDGQFAGTVCPKPPGRAYRGGHAGHSGGAESPVPALRDDGAVDARGSLNAYPV